MNIEQMLDELAKYGEPRLSLMKSGWFAVCDLRIRVDCGDFEIRSEYGHETHISALSECLERVVAVLRDIHKMAMETPLEHQTPALESIG